jgi:hypothetical protein
MAWLRGVEGRQMSFVGRGIGPVAPTVQEVKVNVKESSLLSVFEGTLRSNRAARRRASPADTSGHLIDEAARCSQYGGKTAQPAASGSRPHWPSRLHTRPDLDKADASKEGPPVG